MALEFAPLGIGDYPSAPLTLQSVDPDGDGRKDLVLSATQRGIFVAKHRPGDYWAVKQVLVTKEYLNHVKSLDWDKDGDLDHLVGISSVPALVLRENLGKDHYRDIRLVEVDTGVGYFDLMDLDGKDGLDFVLTSINRGPLLAYYRIPGGGYRRDTVVNTLPDAPQAIIQGFAAADFDKDGDLDLALSWDRGRGVAWAEQAGGEFKLHFLEEQAAETTIRAADLNGDTRPDILTVQNGSIVIYQKVDTGFVRVDIADSIPTPFAPQAVDLDKDGDLDILAATHRFHQIRWFENLGGMSFRKQELTGNFHGTWFLAEDMDGDTLLDIVQFDTFTGDLMMRRGLAGGGRDSSTLLVPPHSVTAGAMRDIDGDGDLDLAVSTTGYGYPAWLENIGDNYWVVRPLTRREYRAYNTNLVDMDKDGDLDILTSRHDSIGDVMLYTQESRGRFEERVIPHPRGYINTARPADMDGDGDLDIVTSHIEQVDLTWMENGGGYKFAPRSITDSEQRTVEPHPADLDGDGDMDILTANFEGDPITVHWNDKLNFRRTVILKDTGAGSHAATADLDRDGDLDVIYSSHTRNFVRVLMNQGKEEFVLKATLESLPGADWLSLDDLDGDGWVDILYTTNANPWEFGVIWNKQGREFQRQSIGYHRDVTGMAAGDVDGDGDQDIFTFSSSSWYPDHIHYWENISPPIPVRSEEGRRSERRTEGGIRKGKAVWKGRPFDLQGRRVARPRPNGKPPVP